MTRIYQRRFDWEKAKARYANGETITEIARSLDVSYTAVQRVVRPKVRQRMKQYGLYLTTLTAQCDRCGGQMKMMSRKHGAKYCVQCSQILRATTVRETTLQCQKCHQWKPDESFSNDKRRIARRGKHQRCTSCQTADKRAWRARNADKERAYQRAYQAERRARNRANKG